MLEEHKNHILRYRFFPKALHIFILTSKISHIYFLPNSVLLMRSLQPAEPPKATGALRLARLSSALTHRAHPTRTSEGLSHASGSFLASLRMS